MTKRIIALLLALILTVGLLPTVALADDAPKGEQTASSTTTDTKYSGADSEQNADNPVHIVKSATTDADGNGTLKLEAYVTDPMTITTHDVPLDIVLVLDQSGSMGFCINCNAEYNNGNWSNGSDTCEGVKYELAGTAGSLTSGELYAYYYGGGPYRVEYCNDQQHRHSAGWYWSGERHNSINRLRDNKDLYRLKTGTTNHIHRLDTLRSVLTSFTTSVENKASEKNVAHRIAMVGFASSSVYRNTELLTGVNNGTAMTLTSGVNWDAIPSNANAYYYPNGTDNINGVQKSNHYQTPTADNYKEALVDVSQNAGKTSITNAINALTAHGGTQTDDGLDMAAKIFENNPLTGNDKGRKRIVILFTDGDSDAEEAAEEQASALKNTYNATVYTVGLFAGADQTKTNGNNGFLQNVSSNNGKAPKQGEKSYYLAATDAASLQEVFKQITEEVNKLMLNVGASTVLSDTLSEYFDFDITANGDLSDEVTFKLVPVDNKDADGNFTWKEADAKTLTGSEKPTLNHAADGSKSFTVTNFDYGANKITRVYDQTTGQITGYTGNKLVIEIPIKADTNCTSWDAKKDTYPTNSSTNGAKLAYWDEKNNPRSTGVASPEAPVARYSVTYDYGTGSEKPADGSMPTDTRAYIDGQTIKVMPASTAPDGYTFDGWYTDAACTPTNKVDAANPPAINKANRTLYGKFTKSVFEVNLSSFVKKELELTGVTELPTEERFTVTLTEGSTTLTATTDAIKSTPDASNLPTFKNGLQSVTLSVGQHTFKVKETAGSTSGMNYDSTEYTLTVTVGANGAVTAVNPTGGITITNTYNPDNAEFNLTGKFQKHLTSNTADVPVAGKEFTLTITGTSNNTDKSTITGTAAVGALTASETSYTGSANFTFKKGTEAVSALTFPAAGTYIYKVQETNSNVAGMTYDTTEYTLTVVVADNAGALEITSAIVTKPGTSDTPVNVTDLKTSFLTIENTFTAAELPLDPTPDPTTGEVTPKIVKKLRVTSGSAAPTADLPFTVAVYEGNAVDEAKRVATGTATIPANSPDETTVNFTGLATLVFPEAGSFTYTIHEDTGSTSGVRYDGYLYTMTVEVTKNTSDNSLSATCSFSYPLGEETVVANSITITNTYTEPKNAQVTNKEVVVTQPEDALKTAVDAFERDNSLTVLYPTGNGTTSNTLEVPYGTTEATLLYKITVFAGTKTYYEFDDVSAKFVYAEHANVAQEGNTFKVTFENGEEYAYVYVAVTHGLNFDDDICEVDNTVLGQTAKTTVKEKDPNSVTVDFSRYVYKKLTVTGDKAFTGATFEAVLDGEWHDLRTALSLEDASAIATYAHATPGAAQLHKTLTVSFDANDDLTQNKAFTGSITFNAEGVYTYTLKEIIPEGATGYDTSEFHLVVTVEANGNGQLEATVSMWFNDELMPIETGILFSNTIDTGKDDYYPIIIPTIINKDTGMLNKTDHFAYVIGYPDGTVHPNGQITRAEVATIFFRLLRDEVRDGAFTTSNSYSDVAYGKWYNNPISTMSALGIITGYPDGTFKPNKPITRAEFAAIAARFDETQSGKSATFSDVIGHWAAKEIGIAYYNDWIKGYPDGTFKPDQNITRAEAMTLINRVLERKPESPADLLTNMNKWTDNMDTSKWYYLDVQEATNSHGYTRKTFNYELWRQMLPDPDWSRYER